VESFDPLTVSPNTCSAPSESIKGEQPETSKSLKSELNCSLGLNSIEWRAMSADAPAVVVSAQAQESRGSLRYAWYVVGALTLVYIFSFIDRQIFSLLVGPLRHDLHISDTQISYLIGIGFVVFFALFGIPIGRLTDIYSRRMIIAIGLVVWSLFTAGCGLAHTFPQMLLLRMGVGAGEAALSPAAYSLITDYFPRNRLATAISVYSMGIYIGGGLSYLVGGLVVHYAATQAVWSLPLVGLVRSWQLIFFIVGLPGIALVLLIYTIREPKTQKVSAGARAPLRQVFTYMRENWKTIAFHNLGFSLLSLSSYAGGAWIPEFYRRRFHFNVSTIGVVFGVGVAVFGCLGITGAGRLADHLRSRGRANANLYVAMLVAMILVPIHFFAYLSPSSGWALAWLAPALALAAAPFGVAPAAIQEIMPAAMRGQASSLYLLVVNLIGLGIGPTAVALCTQYLFRRDDAVQYSLALVTSVSCALAAVILSRSLKPFLASLQHLRAWNAENA
jgi:MFS family permease